MSTYRQGSADPSLPRVTLDYLEYGAPEGERNAALFNAAQQFRDAGYGLDAAQGRLDPRAQADGLNVGEISSTIASAYEGEQREPIVGSSRNLNSRTFRNPVRSSKIKFSKIETAPENLPEKYITEGDRVILETAFKPNEFVSIGDTFESEDGKPMPSSGVTLTREEWLEDLKTRPINKQFTDKNGLFIRVNPMKQLGTKDSDVTAFRHCLVECDRGTKEEQLGALRKLGLPITVIIDSAGKSIHAWVRVDAKDRQEYDERVELVHLFCEQALGIKVDTQNKNPARYSRMPNGNRMRKDKETAEPVLGADGNPIIDQARLLETNVAGKSWSEWREWVSTLSPSLPKPLPKFESWDDLQETKLPELKIVIEDVLNQGAKMTVGGASKAGKTWLLMDLAFAIANGRPWLGIKTYKGRVLYVNLEIQKQFFRKRGGLIMKIREYSGGVPNLQTWTLRGHFMTAESFKEEILERVGNEKFDVIIVDPLYKLLNGADANAAGDMQKILSELEQIAERAGAALIYADHFAKGNMALRSSIDRISGSGVNARDPDVILTFSELEEQLGLDDGRMVAEFTLRNFKPIKPFAVAKIEGTPLFERRDDLDHKRLKGIPGAKPKFSKDDLLKFLPDKGGSTSDDWYQAVQIATGMSERTFNEHRSNLKKDGLVYDSKIDSVTRWVKTPEGIEHERKSRKSAQESTAVEMPENDPFE